MAGMAGGGNGGRVDVPSPVRMNEVMAPRKEAPLPVSAVVLAAVGGMLLFMGLFFGLVAGLGVGGFLIPALAIILAGSVMILVGWTVWRKARNHHEMKLEKERDRLLCDYCGGQNAEGDLKCRFCGAPLR